MKRHMKVHTSVGVGGGPTAVGGGLVNNGGGVVGAPIKDPQPVS